MAKEINLFETSEEEETATPEAKTTVIASCSDQRLEAMLDRVRERKEKKILEEAEQQQIKYIVEAILFASGEPLSANKLREIIESRTPVKPRQVAQALEALEEDYLSQKRSFLLEEVEGGYILRSRPEYGAYIDELYRNKRGEKLSQAATEVLAIIAHRQPITRPQVDAIRGVDSSGTVAALLERGLIEAVGRLEAPGRPTLYGVTQQFLNHFGLRSADEVSTETSR